MIFLKNIYIERKIQALAPAPRNIRQFENLLVKLQIQNTSKASYDITE